MNNNATGSTMNKACQLCKAVHDDAELTIIYDTIYACADCVAAPNLAKVAKIILSTSYRDERTAVVVGFLESQAKEIERLEWIVERGDFITERHLAHSKKINDAKATIATLKVELFASEQTVERLTYETKQDAATIAQLKEEIEELKAAKRPPIVGKL